MSLSSGQGANATYRRMLSMRSASPAAIASANAAVTGSSVGDIAAFTSHAISSAGSINDLISTIPSKYKHMLSPLLRELPIVHEKLCNARRALANLTDCRTKQIWPNYLPAIPNPFDSIQVTREAKSALLPLSLAAKDWHSETKTKVLNDIVVYKEAEVAALEEACLPSALVERILKIIKDDWTVFERSFGKHILPPKADGTPEDVGPKISNCWKADYELALELTPVWVAKVWDFCRVKAQRADAAVLKKRTLVAEASSSKDPDSMDWTPSNLDKVAEEVMKRMEAQKGKPSQARGQVSLASKTKSTFVTNSLLGKRKASEQEGSTARRQKGSTAGNSQELPEECPHHWTKEATESCIRCGVRALAEEEQIEIIRNCKWSPAKPSSIPKQIFDLPREKAIFLIQSRLPYTQVMEADLNVKLGPGVMSIPEKIDKILSLGHRFLFPSTFSKVLPMSSYMSLARRIKWQVHYYYLRKEPSFLDKHPQFRLRKDESFAVPDTTPLWVVTMLEKGRLEMLSQIEAIPSTTVNTTVDPKYKRDLTQLRNWRKTNDFLVLQSDKNLGTTVVSREWYSGKLDGLILNNKDFVEISEANYFKMIEKVRGEIEAFDNDFLLPEIKDYILVDCNIRAAEKNMPNFHGLPKVHKEPWALRPIVPCHSYPLTNASKVLSMVLKPLVRDSPWILESTQDLARLLQDIKLDQSRKYWLCTGDVTAMYPNIPRQRAHAILSETMTAATDDTREVQLVSKLAQWSDNFLAFRHQNKVFYQKDGLAMGIPAAPDVANLYMSHFEDSFAGRFPLYKRYIDDVFVLVEATSYEAALKQLSVIQADGLELTWSVDKKTINFLDLQITQEAGYISFAPYRKPLNSYERLPFTSFHPEHVKRAAFCGEVSRIARLCSNHSTYFTQVSYVRDIYLKRGYPGQLLHKWIKAEAKNRWDSRNTDAPEEQGQSALWLKSEYNNVWQHINLHKVWSAMLKGRVTKPLPLEHITDIKLSLKRFRNLGEINNRYNADTLRALRVEEDVELLQQDVEPIRPAPQQAPRPLIVKWGKEPQTTLNFPKA